eukprot:272932-Pleurochrysis_carterae.AAC.1
MICRFGSCIQVRRLVIYKFLNFKNKSSGAESEKKELQCRLAGLSLLGAVISTDGSGCGLPYADAESLTQMDGGPWTRFAPADISSTSTISDSPLYTPVLGAKMRDAVFRNLADVRSGRGLSPRKALYEPAAHVTGIVLAQMRASGDEGLESLRQQVWTLLVELRDGTQESLRRLLVISDKISENYPEILLEQRGELGR